LRNENGTRRTAPRWLVKAHEHLIRPQRVHRDDLRAHSLERREVLRFARRYVGLVEVEILVSGDVLLVEDVLAVRLPEIAADAAQPIAGHCAIVVLSQRAHPHIEDSLVGRQVRELPAVRRQARRGLFRIAEQHAARDQWNVAHLV